MSWAFWSLTSIAILHGIATADELLSGRLPNALMLAGFTIADLGMLWIIYRR